jgi:hypothetical protein
MSITPLYLSNKIPNYTDYAGLPFVSSRRERIEQAKIDWREGRFGQVPEEIEFIPLPEESPHQAEQPL